MCVWGRSRVTNDVLLRCWIPLYFLVPSLLNRLLKGGKIATPFTPRSTLRFSLLKGSTGEKQKGKNGGKTFLFFLSENEPVPFLSFLHLSFHYFFFFLLCVHRFSSGTSFSLCFFFFFLVFAVPFHSPFDLQ